MLWVVLVRLSPVVDNEQATVEDAEDVTEAKSLVGCFDEECDE